jgi:DNA mismatch repair protein MutS2
MPAASDAALAAGASAPDSAAVLELVREFLASTLGKDELGRLRFQRDRTELERLHRRWVEAVTWIERRGGFGFGGLLDPAELVARARASADGLDGAELLCIAGFLEAAGNLRQRLLDGGEASAGGPELWPELAELAEAIPNLKELRIALRKALRADGGLEDDASPELARLRRQRARQQQALEAVMAEQMRRLGAAGVLQDELVTVRNQRTVLPVRAEMRRRAPGLVQGASSTGQTVFVEPMEAVELNNEQVRLQEAEAAEIRRILRELSQRVAAAGDALTAAARLCGELELEAGKARFAQAYGGVAPEFTDAPAALELEQARHPLLLAQQRRHPERAVVPLSLALGRQRMLVVSGPNTGGKTVVLKTVGIAAWMAQCGLPVCARGAKLPVMAAIHADIGDVQSIQQNLSTFSSHLLQIRAVLAQADDASLVLLDELGTATNAAEGAALAVEVAAWLLQRRAWTLISTHHDALKAWAAEHAEGVVNGSVALDAETLAPTYQFRMGVPGISAGLEMAQRLGLPQEVVAGARRRLSAVEREAAGYLQKLQEQLADAEARLATVAAREQAVALRERAAAAHDRSYLEKQVAGMRADLERRFAAFTAAADKQWRRELEELRADLTSAQKRKLALAEARLKRERAEGFRGELPELQPPAEAAPARLPVAGEWVRLRDSRTPAQVLRRLDHGGFEVAAGALRLQVKAEEIAAVLTGRDAKPRAAGLDAAPAPILELNLIGLRADEASERLQRFLDRALLQEATQVRIVHGAGFGVLRKAVAEELRQHPAVAAFHHPPQNQGGQGVTIADLK